MTYSSEPNVKQVRAGMIAALQSVSEALPKPVVDALKVAAATDDLLENQIARVALWQYIKGRAQERSPEVLITRLAIIPIHPSELSSDPQTALEYFVFWFREAGLPEAALADVTSMEAYYRE